MTGEAAPVKDAVDDEKKFLQTALAHELIFRSATTSKKHKQIRNSRNAAHAVIRHAKLPKHGAKKQVGFGSMGVPGPAQDEDAAEVAFALANAAVTRAQAYFRGLQTRRLLVSWHCSATCIQAVHRGRAVRRLGGCCESPAGRVSKERLRRESCGSDCSADSDRSGRSSGGGSSDSSGFDVDIDFSSDGEQSARNSTSSDDGSHETQLSQLSTDANLATRLAVCATKPAAEVDGRPRPVDGMLPATVGATNNHAHQLDPPKVAQEMLTTRPKQDPRIRTRVFTDEQIREMKAHLAEMNTRKTDNCLIEDRISAPDDRPSSAEGSSDNNGESAAAAESVEPSSPAGSAQMLPMLEIEAQLAASSDLGTDKHCKAYEEPLQEFFDGSWRRSARSIMFKSLGIKTKPVPRGNRRPSELARAKAAQKYGKSKPKEEPAAAPAFEAEAKVAVAVPKTKAVAQEFAQARSAAKSEKKEGPGRVAKRKAAGRRVGQGFSAAPDFERKAEAALRESRSEDHQFTPSTPTAP
jgi:hypothetical protein